MHNPAYLSLSRHGVWYFRWPIPKHFHPAARATDIKVSLGTRVPAVARQLSRVLVCAGQSALLAASLHPMRYDEIRRHVREHFTDLLAKSRAAVAVDGPLYGPHKDTLTASLALAGEPSDEFLAVTTLDGGDALLSAFCERRGITENLEPAKQKQLLNEIQKGYKTFLDEALALNASFDGFDLSPEALVRTSQVPFQSTQTVATEVPYEETVRRYMDEGKRAQSWVLKTIDPSAVIKDKMSSRGWHVGTTSHKLRVRVEATTTSSTHGPRNTPGSGR